MFITFCLKILGYVRVRVCGGDIRRFLSLISSKDYYIWKLSQTSEADENVYCFNITVSDFKRLRPLLKKTGTRAHITERHGIRFLIHRYRHRKCFFISFAMSWIVIYLSTLFIWDINIEGETSYTSAQLIKEIKENHIHAGTLKSDINCAELEKTLRNEYDKIAWISCEIRGTQLNIVITETVETDKIPAPDSPCDLVAAKDGIIYGIVTRKGTPVVTAGTEVKKGDILVSGVIEIMSDYDELMDLSFVSADADVYAIVQYEYYDTFELTKYEKIYTGKEKSFYSISLADNTYTPYIPKTGYENFDTVTEQTGLKLGKTFYLPVSIEKTVLKEFTVESTTYSNDEAKKVAAKRIDKYLEDLMKKKVEILENNVTISIGDGICTASGSITALEPVAIPVTFDANEKTGEYELNTREQGDF